MPKQRVLKIKNLGTLGSNSIFLVNIPGLYIIWCEQKPSHRIETTDRISELPTDRIFLHLPETYLNTIRFALGPFYRSHKNISNIGSLLISNQKHKKI